MIGIIGAMDVEVNTLVAMMEKEREVVACGSVFHIGRLCGQDVGIVVCGIGKVAAAACTQAMIDLFHADAIINTGIAGGLDDRLSVCDLVIATDAIQHDFDVRYFGYAKGFIPGSKGDHSLPTRFVADRLLCERIEKAASLHIGKNKFIRGTVVSGDQFICDNVVRAGLKKDYSAAATEMEGASIAQVCTLNGVPFAIIRAISDLAGDSAGVSYAEFETLAAERSAAIVQSVLSSATDDNIKL